MCRNGPFKTVRSALDTSDYLSQSPIASRKLNISFLYKLFEEEQIRPSSTSPKAGMICTAGVVQYLVLGLVDYRPITPDPDLLLLYLSRFTS